MWHHVLGHEHQPHTNPVVVTDGHAPVANAEPIAGELADRVTQPIVHDDAAGRHLLAVPWRYRGAGNHH